MDQLANIIKVLIESAKLEEVFIESHLVISITTSEDTFHIGLLAMPSFLIFFRDT